MQFSEIKTSLASWLDRSDISASVLAEIINMTVKEIEREWNYRGMQAAATGTLSTDNIAFPTRYKDLKSLFITTQDGERLLVKREWSYINSVYPQTSLLKTPELCASKHDESKIYVRPYPDTSYSYTLTSYSYSADLSADADTNWLLTNHWDAVLFGGLKNATPYIKDTQMVSIYLAKFNQIISQIREAEIKESITGSHQSTAANFVV